METEDLKARPAAGQFCELVIIQREVLDPLDREFTK